MCLLRAVLTPRLLTVRRYTLRVLTTPNYHDKAKYLAWKNRVKRLGFNRSYSKCVAEAALAAVHDHVLTAVCGCVVCAASASLRQLRVRKSRRARNAAFSTSRRKPVPVHTRRHCSTMHPACGGGCTCS